jgi:hypothetical protein
MSGLANSVGSYQDLEIKELGWHPYVFLAEVISTDFFQKDLEIG